MHNQAFGAISKSFTRAHQRQIYDAKELPVNDQQRKKTDVCCAIIGVIFGLIMFIIALCVYNKNTLTKINFPADRKGTICATAYDEQGVNYPFVYFNDINDPLSSRYCLKQCPQQGIKPSCYEKSCPLIFYPNYPSVNSLGQFCFPENQEEKNKLLYKANLYERWNSQKAVEFLLWGVLISVGLSAIVLLFALFLPRFVIWIVTVLSIILLVIAAIVFLANSNTTLQKGSGWAVFAGVLCIVFVLIFLLYLVLHKEKIILAGRILQLASRFIKKNFMLFIYVPIYIGLTFLFGLLTVYEYLAFSCFGNPEFNHYSMFYQLPIPKFWAFLLVIQTIWGLSFFRDSFNYIISSSTAHQFFIKDSKVCIQYQKKCILFNFGSVVGGSFINGFFYFPSLLINLICPRINFFLCNLFDLVRSDSYCYIGLTGNSYCPSVRQCQYLCYRSNICRQNQSINMIYSLATRIFVATAGILIVYWIARDNLVEGKIPPLLLLGVYFIGLYVSCYFVDLSICASQGIMIAFLTEIDMDQVGYADMKIRNDDTLGLRDAIHTIQKEQGKIWADKV